MKLLCLGLKCSLWQVAALLMLPPSLLGQQYSVDWFTIDGGGGTSTNGQYVVSGTIGQPDAGAMSGGNYAIQSGFWSLYMATQTPGAPTLTIRRIGSNVEISWAADAIGFELEEAGNLDPVISWLEVGVAPTVVEGQKIVTVPVQPGQHFFRLRWRLD